MSHSHDTIPLISLSHIAYRYPGGRLVLDDLSFDFFKGSRIGLAAPNGSGKTTLFHIIMGLLKPEKGKIELFGTNMTDEQSFAGVRHRIGLLFQDADDQLFSPTVLEDVAFGPLNMGKSKEKAIDISRGVLAFLGLEGFEERITFKLSGGEKRLVALATILAMKPQVLLLDEPTSGLDEKTKKRLTTILPELNLSYLLISHEFDFLEATTDHIYSMTDGKIHTDEEIRVHSHAHAHILGNHPHKHD